MIRHTFTTPEAHTLVKQFQKLISFPAIMFILIIIGRKLYPNWETLRTAAHQIRIDIMLIGLCYMMISTMILAINWNFILRQYDIQVHCLEAVKMFFLTNLARYVPGGIWHFTGRALWLAKYGYKPSYAIGSFMWEQVIVLVTAILIGGILNFFHPRYIAAWIVFLFCINILISKFQKRLTSKHAWFEISIYLILRDSLFWFLYGMGIIHITASVVGWQSMTSPVEAQLIGQAALSWAAGYVAILIPGGWGIREVVFMNFLSKNFSQEISILIAVLSRTNQILAELMCTVIIIIITHTLNKKTKRE